MQYLPVTPDAREPSRAGDTGGTSSPVQPAATSAATAPVSTPRATIIIPCFNHGRFIRDAVGSALTQVDAQTRVIIVNDGSTDDTTAAACDGTRDTRIAPDAPERVTVLHIENRGLPGARNVGAALARERDWCQYLVFLDADDFIEPTFVSRLHQELAAANDPAVSHAYCQERLVDKAFGTWAVPEWDPLLLLATNLHPVTALVRRDCFEASGGFDESMRLGYEDWDLWINFAARGWRGVRVREPLFNWRRHSAITMVIEAVRRHEQLYAFLMHKHAELYARHADELVRLTNTLLRKADANWLDENHEAIVVRDLRAANVQLWQDICKLRARASTLEARLKRAEAMAANISAAYEGKPVIRVSKKLHQWLDALPGPVSRVVKGTVRRVAR